jgi:hypothetical protein
VRLNEPYHHHITKEANRLLASSRANYNLFWCGAEKVYMSYGFVYLMSNDSLDNIYKIGYTNKSPRLRAQELSNTSSPSDFDVLMYAECFNPHNYETALHEQYMCKRVNPSREFFNLDENDLREITKYFYCFADDVVITCHYKDLVAKFLNKDLPK